MNDSSRPAAKPRVSYFDNVRVLLITLVVIGHVVDVSLAANNTHAQSLYVFIYSFHMPLFIFISGLFTDVGKMTWKGCIRRASYLVCLGFLVKILSCIVAIVLGHRVQFSLLADAGVPWYVFALAFYQLMTCVLKDINLRLVLVLSLALGLFVGYDDTIGDMLYLSRIVVFSPFYWAGVLCDPATCERMTRGMPKALIGGLVIVVFALACVVWKDTIYAYRPLFTGRNSFSAVSAECSWVNRLITYGITVVMCVSVSCVVPHANLGKISAAGARTLAPYAFHWPIIQLFVESGMLQAFLSVSTHDFVCTCLLGVVMAAILLTPPFMKPFALLHQNWAKG